MRGNILGSEIQRAHGVQRVVTRPRKAELRARLVSLGSTAMQWSRPATPASHAEKESTRAHKERPLSRNATAVHLASTRQRRHRLPRSDAVTASLASTATQMALHRSARAKTVNRASNTKILPASRRVKRPHVVSGLMVRPWMRPQLRRAQTVSQAGTVALLV